MSDIIDEPVSKCDEQTAKLLKQQAEKYKKVMSTDKTQKILTGFIEQAGKMLTCGPECQETKEANNALKKYQEAQLALFNGPLELEDTSKTYYTVTQGEEAAEKFSEERMKDLANQIGNTYLEVFDDIVETSKSLSNLYEANLINFSNSKTLSSTVEKQNQDQTTLLTETQSLASTSDRKTFYENQELETLRYWYRIYYYIYILIVLTFLLSMFIVKSEVPFKRQVYILIFLILWFFFGDKAIKFTVNFIKDIFGLIPENVYLTL